MITSASPKLATYGLLASLALFFALALGRAELVALAAPFALVLALGLASAETPAIDARLALEREHTVQGDVVDVHVDLVSQTEVELEIFLRLPAGLEGEDNPRMVAPRAGESRRLSFPLRCDRWGARLVGDLFLRTQDSNGLLVYEARLDLRAPLKVYPHAEALRALPRPVATQALAGNEVARLKGDGIEFADMRPFVRGDQVRRVNWRASARRPELWVNEAHPERNVDVVLFLDSFAEARHGAAGTLDLAVRATASLADHYLRRQDRVGLVSFGGVLRWLLPSTGLAQRYRIVDALLDTEIALSYAWKGVGVIPARTLPPHALVVALTPLLDERTVEALLELRARGFELAVVEVSPLPFVHPGKNELERLARRLWKLRRETLRSRYLALGIAIAEWSDDRPLSAALEEVQAFQRLGRLSRV